MDESNQNFLPQNEPAQIKHPNTSWAVVITAIVVALLVGAGVYLLQAQKIKTLENQLNSLKQTLSLSAAKSVISTSTVQSNVVVSKTTVPTTSTVSATTTDETAGWQTFTSKTEGFTIKYPTDWTLVDTSCGIQSSKKRNGTNCGDRFDFKSPDGIVVRYVNSIDGDYTDKTGCGVQSYCSSQNILALEKINVPNFGQVYLVKGAKGINGPGAIGAPGFWLHVPMSTDTIPIVGENKHSNFMIFFNLPSKFGGRYTLFATADDYLVDKSIKTKISNLTETQFFNLDSVKKAALVLKSLKY